MRKKRKKHRLGSRSKTWPTQRERLTIRENRHTFAHSARATLRDAYRAYTQFRRSTSISETRLAWHLCFANLRRVGHLLKSKDASRSSFLARAIEEAWLRSKSQAAAGHSVLDFIITERNTLLKDGITSLIVEDANENRAPTSPSCAVIWQCQRHSAKEVVASCLRWWDAELDTIEKRATDLKAIKKLPAS